MMTFDRNKHVFDSPGFDLEDTNRQNQIGMCVIQAVCGLKNARETIMAKNN